MKRRIGRLLKQGAGLASVALHRALGPRSGRESGILVYHRVVDAPPGVPPPPFSVSPARLEAQVVGLRERGWRFVSLAEMRADRGRTPGRVAVTFDDIYGSVAVHAAPVLRRLGVPWTAFVATAFVGDDAPMPPDAWAHAHADVVDPLAYRPITPQELHALAADPIVEIGAHTHTHEDFSGRPEAFQADLQTNLDVLRETVGVERPPFAFPFGRTAHGLAGGALTEAALALGVDGTFTTDGDPVPPGTDPVDWPRINVHAWDTPATLDAKLGGRHAWTLRLSERLSRRAIE